MGRDGEGSFRNFESGGGEDNRRAVRQSFVSQEEKYFWAVVTFSSYVRVKIQKDTSRQYALAD